MSLLVGLSILALLALTAIGLWAVSRPYPTRSSPPPPEPKSEYGLVRGDGDDAPDTQPEIALVREDSIPEPPCSHGYTCISCGEKVVCTRCGATLGRVGSLD